MYSFSSDIASHFCEIHLLNSQPSFWSVGTELTWEKAMCQIHCLDRPMNFWTVLHPRKLTWNLKITQWKRNIIFQSSIFGFHVGFQGAWFGSDHLPRKFNCAKTVLQQRRIDVHIPSHTLRNLTWIPKISKTDGYQMVCPFKHGYLGNLCSISKVCPAKLQPTSHPLASKKITSGISVESWWISGFNLVQGKHIS